MTYSEWTSKATMEQRTEMAERIRKIIGTKDEARATANSLSERIRKASEWDKAFERLAMVFVNNGEKALAMNYIDHGSFSTGVTASGKKWIFDRNNGYTIRSRYCGSLFIEGEGTIFTSGRIDKAFEYILNN